MVVKPKQCLVTSIVVFLLLTACSSVQRSMPVVGPPLDVTTKGAMNKDAVRLVVTVLWVGDSSEDHHVYQVSVEKIIKYGATFSSVEPKKKQSLKLSTPPDVTFQQGDVILMDVLTSRIDDGERPLKVRLA